MKAWRASLDDPLNPKREMISEFWRRKSKILSAEIIAAYFPNYDDVIIDFVEFQNQGLNTIQ